LLLALTNVDAACAQVTLDLSKDHLRPVTAYKITNPQNIAVWLSGCYMAELPAEHPTGDLLPKRIDFAHRHRTVNLQIRAGAARRGGAISSRYTKVRSHNTKT
jgi:hypothetical protein